MGVNYKYILLISWFSLQFVTAVYKYEIQKTSIQIKDVLNNDEPLELAITYGLPIPESSILQGPSFPVLLEYLPYRKDDSMYPIRFNYIDYFTSRGFIYGFIDIRGTGGSQVYLEYLTSFV